MSPFKLIVVSIAGLAVAGVATVLVVGYENLPGRRNAAAPAAAPAATPAVVPASATASAASNSPATSSTTPLDTAAIQAAYETCVQKAFPTRADAAPRAAACSRALGSHQLKPDEVALARLTRGIARVALGDKVMASEDYLEAIKHYDRLINPANPDALNLFRRAAALEAIGETDKALADYGDAIKADPDASLAFLNRGILLATRKRSYDRAIQDFDRVLVLVPDNVEALISRGDAFIHLGDFGRGMADLDRAIALSPENAYAYLVRGLAYARRDDARAAMSDYDTTLKYDPNNVYALVNRAALFSLDRKPDLALKDLDRAILLDPTFARAFYNRGYVYFMQKSYDKAIEDYGAAIALDPEMGLAYNNRGLTRAITDRDLTQALNDSDMALKLMPTNLEVRDTRAFIYLKLGEPTQALKEYNEALDIDPNRAISLYGRGLAKIRAGDPAGGKADQAAAETLYPEVAQQFSMYGLD